MKKTLVFVLVAAMMLSMVVLPASADEIKDLRYWETTAREMEIYNVLKSQEAKDLNILSNCFDGLLTNDEKGSLVPNVAKEWTSEDGGKTWVFKLNEGVKWVDYQGNVKADLTAVDFVWGLEWVLNYAKNGASNTSMPMSMIEGAAEYYDYTKTLAETDEAAAKALGIDKLLEMVGIAAPDDYTLVYTCLDKMSYFPTVTTYNCLYPVSPALLEEVGVDGFLAITWDTNWYNGPYTITTYVHQNEKVLTATPNYWNAENMKRFDTVTYKMVESIDVGYQLFQTGELDYIQLSESNLNTIYNSPSNEFHNYLTEARPTKYSYQMHLVYDKNLESGDKDVNWNTAIASENFRKALYYGLDLTNYLSRTNAINPLACQNFCYTANGVAVNSAGVDYTQLVRDEMGLQYSNETFARVNADLAAQYKAAAMEELTAKGVTFPVTFDYYINGASQTAKDTADVLAEIFSDCLGDDFAVLNIKTYVSSLNNEVRNPQLASFFINGWGADFGDPINFLGQETYGDDNAYYSVTYSKINNATDEQLIADYKEFSALVETANAITDDLDARYAAFAKAEAYMLDKAFVIPMSYEVAWQLTGINDYTRIYVAYGIQATRFVNWETNSDLYTTEDYAAFAAAQ